MVKVLINSDPRYPVDRHVVKKAVEDVLKRENVESLDVEVSVLVCGARKMRDLSNKYLKDSDDHEVLSFPLQDGDGKVTSVDGVDEVMRLGDVVISWPQVLELAAKENIFVDEKLAFLVSHGVEHLLGKHHED